MLFWNRKGVYAGVSLERSSEIRRILSYNNIKYSYKVVNRNNSSIMGSNRARVGSMGESVRLNYMYYIYVHKKDHDKAIKVLSSP